MLSISIPPLDDHSLKSLPVPGCAAEGLQFLAYDYFWGFLQELWLDSSNLLFHLNDYSSNLAQAILHPILSFLLLHDGHFLADARVQPGAVVNYLFDLSDFVLMILQGTEPLI